MSTGNFKQAISSRQFRAGNFEQDVHAQFARVGKALSNGNRLELLEFVAQGARSWIGGHFALLLSRA